MPVAPNHLEPIFAAVAALPFADRAAFLDRACANDAALRGQIEALLRAHDRAGQVLDSATVGMPARAAECVPCKHPGSIVAGRYKLLEAVGEGGMGRVYVAEQTQPVRRKVALKLIKAGLDSKCVSARFDAERQALALMDHPHIAKVYDGGLTDLGRPFFVMELVKGVPITDYCDAARMTVPERLGLFAQVCQAVQHAHQKGIIHRDLKPSNILVAHCDEKPAPKIIDFGLAKALHFSLTDHTLHTAHDNVIGTPLYMSPEQAQLNNLDIDTRSDIYSLGVLLYELLTGTTPLERQRFKEATWDEVRRIIREEDSPRPSTRLSSTAALTKVAAGRQTEPARLTKLIRGELDWIVMKALEKDRNRRYDTANSFAVDVQRFLAGEPALAGPPSARYRIKKFVSRNRGPVAVASVLLLALLAGIAGTSLGLLRARRAEILERNAKLEAEAEKTKALQAAVAEKAAKLQTEKRLAQIEKAVELFAGLLKGIDPVYEARGAPPVYDQLRRRAEQAADQLNAELVADPLAMARLQSTLGKTLLDFGSTRKAVALLEQARSTREARLGAADPLTLETVTFLAHAYVKVGRVPDGIRLHERVRDARLSQLGADHPNTLAALSNLAIAYFAAGRQVEAIKLYEQVRELQRTRSGPDSLDALAAQNNLATAYLAAGRYRESVALFEHTRESFVTRLGADHVRSLGATNNLANAYQAVGRLPEATMLLEQASETLVRKLGIDSPDTLSAQNNLALAYVAAGREAEAIPMLEQVRDIQMNKLGAGHLSTLGALGNLGGAYLAAGRAPDAIGLFEKVRDARIAKQGPDHRDTLTVISNVAEAYQRANRLAEAIPIFEQVRDARRRKFGPDHPNTLLLHKMLAGAYQAAGRDGEAIALFEQAARGIEKHGFRQEHARNIMTSTIAAYDAQKQFDRADAWAQKWLAAVKEQAGADSTAYAEALAMQGRILLRRQNCDRAEVALRESLAIFEHRLPDDWRTFNATSLLGGALLGQNKYAEAEPRLLRGYENLKLREAKISTRARPCVTEALQRLVQLYDQVGKIDEAAKWRDELKSRSAREENRKADPEESRRP
jgi:tetratricopeptide (TPR) repeat protein